MEKSDQIKIIINGETHIGSINNIMLNKILPDDFIISHADIIDFKSAILIHPISLNLLKKLDPIIKAEETINSNSEALKKSFFLKYGTLLKQIKSSCNIKSYSVNEYIGTRQRTKNVQFTLHNFLEHDSNVEIILCCEINTKSILTGFDIKIVRREVNKAIERLHYNAQIYLGKYPNKDFIHQIDTEIFSCTGFNRSLGESLSFINSMPDKSAFKNFMSFHEKRIDFVKNKKDKN